MERFCELKQKEVINVCDGCRLGYVTDLELDVCTGKNYCIDDSCRKW